MMTSVDRRDTASSRWTDITDPQGILRALRGLRGQQAWDVVVAVDPDPGMTVWHDTAVEFTDLLRRSRVFRRVDRCALRALPPGHPSPGRLTLAVTDGNAPGWRTGALGQVLHRWAAAGTLAVVHLLPHQAWPESGVPTWPLSLRSAGPGAPNRRHGTRPRQLGLGAPEESGPYLPVPVLELAPRSLESWVGLINGARGTWTRLPLTFTAPRPEGPRPAHTGPGSAADRVAAFRRSVSPEVSGLATLLAATPLGVPVIRRVLSRLRPGARISDFTQLLTHGLIHPVTGARIAYDFAPDVRGELLAAGRTEELRRVVDVVGEALGPSAHRLWQVPELLAGRRLPLPLGPDPQTRAWAEPQIAVLHALSGPHAAQARALERMTAASGARSATRAAPAPPLRTCGSRRTW